MNSFIIICALVIPVFSAPQGYEYKKPAPVIESLQSFGLPKFSTCKHAAQTIEDIPFSLIQSQSQGRIVNHKINSGVSQNLVAAASGYSPQIQSNSLYNDESVSTQFPPSINVPPQEFSSGGNRQQTLSGQRYGYSSNHQNIAANAQIHNYTPITPGPVRTISTENVGYKHDGSYENSFGHTSNLAASTSTHHNIQHETNVGSNFANSVVTSGSSDAYSGLLLNSASHHSSAQNSIKHTINTNLNFNVGALNGQLGQVIRETFDNAPLDPSIEKHIYVHVPPEDLEEDNVSKFVNHQQPLNPPKKHYKIIFIKAPSYPTPNYSQLAAVAPQTEEKTLVYVLVKKPELPSLEQIQQSTYKSSKPEVYFIKYKTHKDGDHNDSIGKQPIDTHSTENGNELIDIRSGGESNSITTSTSFSSSFNGVNNNEPKHELYGVPLE